MEGLLDLGPYGPCESEENVRLMTSNYGEVGVHPCQSCGHIFLEFDVYTDKKWIHLYDVMTQSPELFKWIVTELLKNNSLNFDRDFYKSLLVETSKKIN